MRTIIAILSFATACVARDWQVSSVEELRSALHHVEPGTSIILREGEWRNAQIIFKAQGTIQQPITLKAAVPGKTILTGNSALRLAGEYLVIDGLRFLDPDPEVTDLVQFRNDSDELAHHCRMTNCSVMRQPSISASRESRWINVYGSDNRIDHCAFEGKAGKGATFVVWLNQSGGGRHRIDHNYFGPREELGKNGGETIRVGDSKTADIDAGCIVESNLFEKCNGETECISNKSCGNVYRDNTFLEVSGSLTLRHGNRCLVERNAFIGNKALGTGGVRIVGEDHIIRGNYFENLTGDDARAAICLMMGIPNSPANRYRQIKNVTIEGNSIVNCKHPILIGLSDDKKATLVPETTVFRGNQVSSPKRPVVEAQCNLAGITWEANRFASETLGIPEHAGIIQARVDIAPLKPLARIDVGPSW